MFCPPLRDEFTKFGDRFEKITHNEGNRISMRVDTVIDRNSAENNA